MTTKDPGKDDSALDDAEFEAFLRGEDELASLLQSLPQQGASAQLDAAVLAQAEAALGTTGLASVTPSPQATASATSAANDAAMVPSAPLSPSPVQRARMLARWKVPLALAASLILSVNLIGIEWFASHPTSFPEAIDNSRMKAAPSPVATPSATPAATSPEAGAPEPTSAAAPEPSASSAPAPPVTAPARPSAETTQRRAVQEAGDAALRAPAPPSQAAEATAPAPVMAPPPPPPPAAPSAPPVREYHASPAPPAAPMGAMATTPPEWAGASARAEVAKDAQAGVAAPRSQPSAKMASPVRRAPAPLAAATLEAAPAWLARIETMAAQATPADTLAEWRRFREAYPDYPVAPELRSRIEALSP